MLLECTPLERQLADIVATTMPGHGGGDAPDPEPEDAEREPDDEAEEQPS